MFIRMAAPFLFWAPYVHHQALQKMWVDGVMHKSVWEEAMKKLNEEWQDLVLLVCLFVIVNITLLTSFLGNGAAEWQRGIPGHSICGRLGHQTFVCSSDGKLPLHSG